MDIVKGKVNRAQKVVIYGAEGIGKTTLAAHFPNPLFIDIESGTHQLEVDRTVPGSWDALLNCLREIPNTNYKTVVIDTADAAEHLCSIYVCQSQSKTGIEDFGYGKGYTYLAEEFNKLLALSDALIAFGVNVVLVAHAAMRKFEQPDELGAYDRWELKLQKKTAPLVKEWADLLLFCNYKTYLVTDQNGAKKAQGGKRVMYTSHHPCWDAKNRHGLAAELPMEYASIAGCIPGEPVQSVPASDPIPAPSPAPQEPKKAAAPAKPKKPTKKQQEEQMGKLLDKMGDDNISGSELLALAYEKGWAEMGTQILDFKPELVTFILNNWGTAKAYIEEARQDLPF